MSEFNHSFKKVRVVLENGYIGKNEMKNFKA